MNKLPNTFLVGPPKTGSTALHRFLGEHPDIYMSYPKEVGYFCRDLWTYFDSFGGGEMYPFRNLSAYHKIFKDVENEARVGEASTHYFHSHAAPEKIKEYNPDARIIITIREPIDYILSLHGQLISSDTEKRNDIECILWNELETLPPDSDYPRLAEGKEQMFYLKAPYYASSLERRYDIFDKEQIHIVIFEEFKKDNAGVYKEILEFLGVDSSFEANFRKVNVRHTYRSLWLKKIVDSPWFFRPFKKLLPRSVYLSWKEKFLALMRVKQAKPTLSDELRLALQDYYHSEIQTLEKMIHKDLLLSYGYNK